MSEWQATQDFVTRRASGASRSRRDALGFPLQAGVCLPPPVGRAASSCWSEYNIEAPSTLNELWSKLLTYSLVAPKQGAYMTPYTIISVIYICGFYIRNHNKGFGNIFCRYSDPRG